MVTVPANPAMRDVFDTFWAYIVGQLRTINPTLTPPLKPQGIVNAQDWPQRSLVDGGLYLLYLRSVELPGRGTVAQSYYEHFFQWAWVYLGSDLAATEVGANRGDRYANDAILIEALRQAHFPGFTPKQQISFNGTTGAATFTPYDPIEMVTWNTPRFGTKMANAQSGILYGTAPLEVYAYSSANPVVDP